MGAPQRHPERHPDDLPPSGLRPPRRHLPRGLLWALALAAVVFFVAVVTLADEEEPAVLDGSLAPPVDLDPRTAAEATGQPLPDVEFAGFGAGTTSLAEYRGRPTVVNFWASTCAPCIQEMPALEEVHQELGDEVAFVGLSVAEGVPSAERMIERTGVTYDLGRDPTGEIMQALGGTVLPTTVVADASGTITAVHVGQIDADELRSLLAEAGA